MNVGFKIGLAALSAGAVGAFGGKVVGAEGDNRLAGLGIAAAGAGIGSIAALTSGAPRWSAGVVVAAAGVGYLLGSTLFGGSGPSDGVRNLAPGPSDWDRSIRDLGRGMRLPEREFVPDNPVL